jgi:hypothetical protein
MGLRIPFVAAAVAITAVMAFATPAAAQDEFVVERSASFDLTTPDGDSGGCTGEVWVGRTATGFVEAATTVRCTGAERRLLQTYLVIHGPGEIAIKPEWESGCHDCRSFALSGSEPGGAGWCARGYAGDVRFIAGNAISYEGVKAVCV